MDDKTAQRLGEALEKAAQPAPRAPDPGLSAAQVDAIRRSIYSDPASPFRHAQERKRKYLARGGG